MALEGADCPPLPLPTDALDSPESVYKVVFKTLLWGERNDSGVRPRFGSQHLHDGSQLL